MNVEWKVDNNAIDYLLALEFMEERVGNIINKSANEMVWLLEHNHVYTGGTSAKASDLLRQDVAVYNTGRGGQYTYHGPGQRIAYVMLDLKARNAQDVRLYIYNLEEWIIKTLSVFGIKGERRKDRVGIWVVDSNGVEKKIAAIGVRLRKWVTFHGIAINLNPDLSYFNGIVPCGLSQFGVTSIQELGVNITKNELDIALKDSWDSVF